MYENIIFRIDISSFHLCSPASYSLVMIRQIVFYDVESNKNALLKSKILFLNLRGEKESLN